MLKALRNTVLRSLQTFVFPALPHHGRGGFRTCDLSRVKRWPGNAKPPRKHWDLVKSRSRSMVCGLPVHAGLSRWLRPRGLNRASSSSRIRRGRRSGSRRCGGHAAGRSRRPGSAAGGDRPGTTASPTGRPARYFVAARTCGGRRALHRLQASHLATAAHAIHSGATDPVVAS